jgi:hypothetical protein
VGDREGVPGSHDDTTGCTLMPHWISETLMAIVSYLPAMIVDQESPNFPLIRAMFGLLLIAMIVYVIAMTPFRSAVAHSVARVSGLFSRRQ